MGKIRISAILTAACVTIASFGVSSDSQTLGISWGPPAEASTAPPAYGTQGFVPSSVFQASTPASWDAAKGQTMATILSSCSTPIQTSIMGFGSAMAAQMGGPGMASQMPQCPLAMGITIDSVCPLSDLPIDASALSCQNFNQGLVDQIKMQLSSAYCSAACKSAKMAAIRQEIQCVQQLASNLNIQAKSVGEMFSQNILRMQAQVQAYKGAMADRDAQINDVNTKLLGDKVSGATGLLALKDATDKLIAAMPGEIQAARQRSEVVGQWQKSLDGQVQLKKASDMMSCFNTQPISGYKCTMNDTKTRSGKEALLCAFDAYSKVGKNGIIERDQVTEAQGKSKAAELSALLDQLGRDAPTEAKIPTTQQDLANISQQNRLILNVADVRGRYYERLKKFRFGNQNAGDAVVGIMDYCYKRAEQMVARDRKDQNSLIAQATFNIKKEKEAVLDQMKPLFQKYNNQYTENMRALTGSNYPLNTSGCDRAPADTQIRCLEDIRKNMVGQFYGTTSNSQMKMQVKGSNPQTYFSFTCQGLNGCVTNLQNVSRNLRLDRQKLESDKNTFVSTANKTVQDYAIQVAKQLNGPSQMLTMKLQALMGAAQSVGGSMPNAMLPMRPEVPQFDEEKLIKPPLNTLAFIGASVTPPLPELNALMLNMPMNNDNLPRISSEFMKIATLKDTCAYQRINDAVTQAGSMAAANCYSHPLCNNQLDNMTSTISSLSGRQGVPPGAGASLLTGYAAACQPPMTGQITAQMRRDLNEEQLNMLRTQQASVMMNSQPQGCMQYFAGLQSAVKTIQMYTGPGGSSGSMIGR
jgi:hypothetical protein